jgi:hypothetical protein
MTYSDLILLLTGYRASKPTGSVVEAGRAFCPSHQSGAGRGRGRTLSTAQSSAGAILLHCHAGCSAHEICEAVGVDESDLFPDTPNHTHGTGKGVGTTWYPAMALADAIDDACCTLIKVTSVDELHQKIHHIGQLVAGFKAACRAASRNGGAA